MKNILHRIRTFRVEERWIPWLLLAAAAMAYLPLIRSLGFYWDDWEILYLSTAAEVPTDIFLFPFRPLHVYIDIFTVRLLGYNPLVWHLLFFVIRYLGGLSFWLLLKEIWPDKTARNAWAALLFLVYPSFLHSAMSVAYRQHFTTALVFLLSVWLMARAYNLRRAGKNKPFWLSLAFSLLLGMTHLFITEYFAALELWRPLILGILIFHNETLWKKRIGKLLSFWLPYLVYTGGYVFWRLMVVQNQIDDPNQAALLDNLKVNPIPTLIFFIQDAFIDLRYMLLGSWVDTFSVELVNLASPVSLLVLAVVFVSGIAAFWLLFNLKLDHTPDSDSKFPGGSFLLGFAGLILGLAPAWIIGRHITEGRYDTRFSIPALAGTSLLVVALIFFMIPNRKKASTVLAVMLALAIGQQIHMSNLFRWDWQRQTRIYWQLSWRAPHVEEKTAFLVNRSLSNYATTYPVAYAVNILYSPDDMTMSPNYWWFEIYESNLYKRTESLYAGDVIRTNFHFLDFRTQGTQTLVVNLPTAAQASRCLWLLDASDSTNPAIPGEMQQLAALSDLSLINTESTEHPTAATFGTEPARTWCYYFQKADLAVQIEDWQTAQDLYAQAKAKKMKSEYIHEYLPFITASFASNNWELALEQTITAQKFSRNAGPNLCAIWQNYPPPTENLEAFEQALAQINENFKCEGD